MAHSMTSSKPYLIRAIHDWILDNAMTPHLLVDVDYPGVEVPMDRTEDGRVVLNIAPGAVRGLEIGNDWISFSARFSGVAHDILAPSESVVGIFARETGQGMAFPDPDYPTESAPDSNAQASGPTLTAITNPQAKTEKSAKKTDGDGDPDPSPPSKKGPTLRVVK